MRIKYFNTIILSLLAAFCITSCSNEDSELTTPDTKVSGKSSPDYVFGIVDIPETNTGKQEKGVMMRSKNWTTGQTIKIKFLDDGYEYAKEKIKEYAAEWTLHANVNFEYVDKSQNADVKIAFNWEGDRVFWSYIGTDAKRRGQNQPSMNLSMMDESVVDLIDFKAAVLREFGHMLGLGFEHLGRKADFQIDQDKVLSYFLIQGWSESRIRTDILKAYTVIQIKEESFDRNSIMMLYLPEFLLKPDANGNPVYLPYNTELSPNDKAFIRKQYPGREATPAFPLSLPLVYTDANGNTYDYTAVKIGEYLWMNSNFKNPVYTPSLTQHQINRCVWVYRGDSLYRMPAQVVNDEIGQYYLRWQRDSFGGTMAEKHSGGTYEKPWKTPALVDYRQLFAMCGDASEHNVRQMLCYKEGENPIAVKGTDIFWMSGNNTNDYGFNLIYAGMRYHGVDPQIYSPWPDNRREIVINQSDVEGIFNMHVFHASDGVALLEDYPNTLKWQGQTFWWTPLRWCRALTDDELGYKLYVNAEMTDIKKLGLSDACPQGYSELGKGYLRGFYVQYILDNPNPSKTVAQLKQMAQNLPDVTHHGAPIIN